MAEGAGAAVVDGAEAAAFREVVVAVAVEAVAVFLEAAVAVSRDPAAAIFHEEVPVAGLVRVIYPADREAVVWLILETPARAIEHRANE
ncbi:MAG: hypothetical protein JOZ08_17015 [Verrucomicrobia bacterium]|nr:hypothetical protein [Verrucomicrobiota bacterium]MBV8273722.1 hypothetical protein [Verrucomicrobiota bacterium]